MSDFWQRAFFFPFFLLLFALLIWAIAGALPAVLVFACGLALRLLHHLRNLADLLRWLKDPENLALPDGSGLWVEVFSQLNKMVRTYRQQRDRQDAALRQMEQATGALPEGVVILDDADRIEWCNPLAEKHLGLDISRGNRRSYSISPRAISASRWCCAARVRTTWCSRSS